MEQSKSECCTQQCLKRSRVAIGLLLIVCAVGSLVVFSLHDQIDDKTVSTILEASGVALTSILGVSGLVVECMYVNKIEKQNVGLSNWEKAGFAIRFVSILCLFAGPLIFACSSMAGYSVVGAGAALWFLTWIPKINYAANHSIVAKKKEEAVQSWTPLAPNAAGVGTEYNVEDLQPKKKECNHDWQVDDNMYAEMCSKCFKQKLYVPESPDVAQPLAAGDVAAQLKTEEAAPEQLKPEEPAAEPLLVKTEEPAPAPVAEPCPHAFNVMNGVLTCGKCGTTDMGNIGTQNFGSPFDRSKEERNSPETAMENLETIKELEVTEKNSEIASEFIGGFWKPEIRTDLPDLDSPNEQTPQVAAAPTVHPGLADIFSRRISHRRRLSERFEKMLAL